MEVELDYWEQYKRKENTDAIFEVTDEDGNVKEYHIHRIVFSAISDVFNAMFFGPLAETSEKISIADVTAPAFQHLIKYAYQKRVHLESVEGALRLAYAAKKYLVDPLYEEALNYVSDNLSSVNAIFVIESNYTFEPYISDQALELIIDHLDKIKKANSHCLLSPYNFMVLVEHIHNLLEATDLFNLTYTFAKSQCLKDGLTLDGSTLRTAMNAYLPFIRFLQFTPAEFVASVLPLGMLSVPEITSITTNLGNYDGNLKCPLPSWCNKGSYYDFTMLANRTCGRSMTRWLPVWRSRFSVSEKATLLSFCIKISNSCAKCRSDCAFKLLVEIRHSNSVDSYFTVHSCKRDKNYWCVPLIERSFIVEANKMHDLTVTFIEYGEDAWKLVCDGRYDAPWGRKLFFDKDEYEYHCPASPEKPFKIKFHECPDSDASIFDLRFSVRHSIFLD